MSDDKSTPNPSDNQLLRPGRSDLVEIPLTYGHIAFIDPADVDLAALKWRAQRAKASHTVYARRTLYNPDTQKSGLLYLHREVMSRVLGRPLDSKEQVDHIDRNGLNNRRSNLRLASAAQNQHNGPLYKNNKSGYRGVLEINGRFRAQIRCGKVIYLGTFDTAELAYAAYCEAAKKYFGEFS